MKKMLAGALFGLVILGAQRAEANMKLNLVVRSCDPNGLPWKAADQDNRLGRVIVKDQGNQVVQTQGNVHFSSSRCEATFTMTFEPTTLLRFVDPDDPLTVTLEACNKNQATCPAPDGPVPAVLDADPVVFLNQALDSVVPDVARLQAQALADAIADSEAADQVLADALADEITRAMQAEVTEMNARVLAVQTEALRAMGIENALRIDLTAEATARADAIEDEAQARADAIADEAQARADAIADEAQARTDAIADEAQARTDAIADEADARADGDQAVRDYARDYADETFLPLTGGTVDGELVVTGVLRLNGGVSWDACPEGLDAVEHVFEANQGTNNRLCASAFMQTDPSVLLNEVLGSYIKPICPMVTQVVQNYVEIGGPAVIDGINLLLQQVSGLLNDQIAPFANGLIGATTDVTNDLIDSINGKIGEINALVAAHTAGINSVIDAYNGLVTKINTALTSSTNGLNGSITAVNNYLTTVRNEINGVVAGINSAVGDVNTAFASIDSSLGSASDALNAFNNSPTGINTALSSLTTTLNARIATINGLLDSISSAQSSIVSGFNSGVDQLRANFGLTVDYINNFANNVRSQIIGPLNSAIDALDAGAIDVGNYLVDFVNGIIGPKTHSPRAGINGVLSWVQSTTLGAVNFPWFEPIPTIGSTTATGLGDINLSWSIGSYLPSPGVVSAPAAIGHVGTVNAPTISSLGLPTFDLGVSASMGTVSHGLNAPALAAVNAPQIVGATVNTLVSPGIPNIPHVALPSIPAWDGFQLEDAVDFDGVSGLIGTTMGPICLDIAGTTQSYIHAFLGNLPAALEVPAYGDAEEECGALGAHVCSATEIGLLASEEDGTPAGIGYGFGDWTSADTVVFNQAATSGLMLETPWPFFKPDASKLMTFPPGFPFTFTPPVLPTGRFRCCASSSSFQ